LDRLDPPDGPWLVAGTGGAARAAAIAAETRDTPVAVCSRSPARKKAFETWGTAAGVEFTAPRTARVLINATPVGLHPGDPLPIPPELVPEAEVALDMVYQPGTTPWVRAMQSKGLRAADGREMLVAQGAAALQRWFPGVSAPVEIMRAAIHAILR
jgi:shikimate dehydrogenase